jgi:hypothetical protein
MILVWASPLKKALGQEGNKVGLYFLEEAQITYDPHVPTLPIKGGTDRVRIFIDQGTCIILF